jgi:hypothetical protein
MNDSPVPEWIQANIRASRAKYKARVAKDREERGKIKEGVAYIHENRDQITIRQWPTTQSLGSPGYLSIGIQLLDPLRISMRIKKYKIAFAFCSPKDQYCRRIEKGLIGYRLKHGLDNFSFSVSAPNEVLALSHAQLYLLNRILNYPKRLPSWFVAAARETHSLEYNYVWLWLLNKLKRIF